MAQITFKDIASVLIPAGNELLWDFMRGFAYDNLYTWYNNVYDVVATSSWENQTVSAQHTRLWPEWDEQMPIPMTEWEDVDRTITELTEYVDSFPVTRRYLMYGDPHTAVQHIIPRLKDFLQSFLASGLKRVSLEAAMPLYDAFAGNVYTGIDGMPLCDHIHTGFGGVTFSNKISNQLNAAGLTAAFTTAEAIVDRHGVPLDIEFDTLIIPKHQKQNAFDILNNTVVPGGTNASKNYWHGVIDKVVICPWLTANAQQSPAGVDDWWFLVDSRRNTLKGFIGEEPHLLDTPKISPVEMKVSGITSCVFAWHDWRGVLGSDGTET